MYSKKTLTELINRALKSADLCISREITHMDSIVCYKATHKERGGAGKLAKALLNMEEWDA